MKDYSQLFQDKYLIVYATAFVISLIVDQLLTKKHMSTTVMATTFFVTFFFAVITLVRLIQSYRKLS